MSKWLNAELTDPVFTAMSASFDAVALSDELALCAGQPASFFEAVNPDAWAASTVYALDSAVRPSVDRNGFTYQCTTAGTSGVSEPVWPTTAGQTVTDGTACWTAHTCRAVGNISMGASDFVKITGQLTIMPKTGIVSHSSGTYDHVALLMKSEKKLILVTTCVAQTIVAGNIINTAAFKEKLVSI